MRFLRRSLSGLFLTVMAFIMVVITMQSVFQAVQAQLDDEPPSQPDRERVFAVNVIVAEPRAVEPVLETFGEVRSIRTLEVRATSAGAVVALSDAFVEGGRVLEGDLLVRLDPRDAQSARAVAENALAGAEAELRDGLRARELAEADLEVALSQVELRERGLQRELDMVEQGIGTATAAEAAEIALIQARQAVVTRRASLAREEARIENARTELERRRIELADAARAVVDTEIRAEFDGTISDVSAVAGGLVGRNERLASLIDDERLEVQFRVSTGQYARLIGPDGALLDLPVTIALDVAGVELTATGRLSRVGGAVAEGQTGRLLFARLDSAPEFQPGDFVVVRVTEPRVERVVRLPATAYGSDNMILAIGGDDRLEALPVELVRRQGDDVLVRAPDLRGRQIVAERTPVLGAGIRVRSFEPGGADGTPEAEAAAPKEEAGIPWLSGERLGKVIAFVENETMADDEKRDILALLSMPEAPADLVGRIESRLEG